VWLSRAFHWALDGNHAICRAIESLLPARFTAIRVPGIGDWYTTKLIGGPASSLSM
jgi:hypothetical protein